MGQYAQGDWTRALGVLTAKPLGVQSPRGPAPASGHDHTKLARTRPAGFAAVGSKFDVSPAADEHRRRDVDQLDAILSRPKATAFSIRVDSTAPVVSRLTHDDLFLDGGWAAIGAPQGLAIQISAI